MSLPRSRRWAAAAAGATLPWSWFLVRELGGRLEAVAVALPVLVLVALGVTAVIAALLRERLIVPTLVSLAAFGLAAILGPRLPHTGPAPADPIRLVTANVYFGNEAAAAVETLLATDADVLVAVETSSGFRDLLASRDGSHPYVAEDDQLLVRSRFPVTAMADPADVPARRILRVTVEAPSGPFVLYAVHALNPLSESTFADQLDWVDRLRASAGRETTPVVIAGDFNMSDRQLGYRRLTADLPDAVTSAGWGHSTYPHGIWGPLLLRIDHVFISPQWCAARAGTFQVPGSDHDGIQLDLGPCP